MGGEALGVVLLREECGCADVGTGTFCVAVGPCTLFPTNLSGQLKLGIHSRNRTPPLRPTQLYQTPPASLTVAVTTLIDRAEG